MGIRYRAVFKGGIPSLKYGPVPSPHSPPFTEGGVYGSNPVPRNYDEIFMDQSFSQSFHSNP